MTNWLLVSSADNFETSRARGFDIAGMKTRHRKKAERVQPGDRVLYYLTVVKSIGGIAEVTGSYYEDHTKIWESKKGDDEVYPFRFPVKLLCAREKGQYLEMEDLIPQIEYVKRWPPQHWTLAFQGNVHVLGDADYGVIAKALGCP